MASEAQSSAQGQHLQSYIVRLIGMRVVAVEHVGITHLRPTILVMSACRTYLRTTLS